MLLSLVTPDELHMATRPRAPTEPLKLNVKRKYHRKYCQHPRTWLTLLKHHITTFRGFSSGCFVWIDQAFWNYVCWGKVDKVRGLLTWYSLLLCWLTSARWLRISVLPFPNTKLITVIPSVQHLQIYGWKELSYLCYKGKEVQYYVESQSQVSSVSLSLSTGMISSSEIATKWCL